MKKLFLILGVTAVLVSCGKTEKKEESATEDVICAEPTLEDTQLTDSLSTETIEEGETDVVVEKVAEGEGDSK